MVHQIVLCHHLFLQHQLQLLLLFLELVMVDQLSYNSIPFPPPFNLLFFSPHLLNHHPPPPTTTIQQVHCLVCICVSSFLFLFLFFPPGLLWNNLQYIKKTHTDSVAFTNLFFGYSPFFWIHWAVPWLGNTTLNEFYFMHGFLPSLSFSSITITQPPDNPGTFMFPLFICPMEP